MPRPIPLLRGIERVFLLSVHPRGCDILLVLIIVLLVGSHRARGEDEPSPRSAADAELAELRKGLPPNFHVAREGCFVVVGDMDRGRFDEITNGTIAPCAEALHRAFFARKPNHTIAIYLFDGEKSYREWAKKLFGEEPTTPFGYFSESERRMVMNIRTGTGTLVHEMVHALIKPDFPDAPTWLNEGLGSLFEQCRHRPDGTLEGLINWRYEGLMEAVEKKSLLRLKDLVRTSDAEFRGPNEAANYAQARYFCMYLQQRKLLQEFYKTFRDRYNEDRSGEKFLVDLLGANLDEVEKEWIHWAQGLRP